jgi:hypothetical protein
MESNRRRGFRALLIAAITLGALGYGGSVWWRLSDLRHPEIKLSVAQIAPRPSDRGDDFTSFAKPGENCQYTFQLTNQGTTSLEGLRISPSCQCQVAAALAAR